MRKQFAIALATALLLAGGSAIAQNQQQNAQQPKQQNAQPQQNMQMQQNAQGQQNTTQRPKAASAKKTKHKMSSNRHHKRMATSKKHHRLAKSKRHQAIGTASMKSKSMQQARRPVRETTGTGGSQSQSAPVGLDQNPATKSR